MTSAVILGMIVTMFPEPREQAKAIGVYSFVASAGASIGLLAGGVLTQALSWHWIFFVNVPIGIATARARRCGCSRRTRASGCARAPTCPAPCSSPAALMLGVYTIVERGRARLGLGCTRSGSAPSSLALLGGFVARQATAATPLLPLRHLPLAHGRRART